MQVGGVLRWLASRVGGRREHTWACGSSLPANQGMSASILPCGATVPISAVCTSRVLLSPSSSRAACSVQLPCCLIPRLMLLLLLLAALQASRCLPCCWRHCAGCRSLCCWRCPVWPHDIIIRLRRPTATLC